MENIQNQDISNWKIWKEYKTETLTEETSDYWKSYEYWQIKEKLTPWIEVKKTDSSDPRIDTHKHDWTTDNWVKIDYTDLASQPTIMPTTHTHSWGADWSKVSYTDLDDKPTIMPATHTHSWWTDWSKVSYDDLDDKPARWNLFISRDLTWWTTYSAWTFKVVTWFKPREIHIEASRYGTNDNVVSFWDCVINNAWTKTQIITYYWDNAWQTSPWLIIYVRPWGTSVQASVWTIYSNWFDLVFPNNNYLIQTKIIAKW